MSPIDECLNECRLLSNGAGLSMPASVSLVILMLFEESGDHQKLLNTMFLKSKQAD